MADVTIVEGADSGAIADWLEARITAALASSEGPVAITVPGGSTPFPIMEQLVTRQLDWSRLVVWPGDDRIVPEDHAASNTGKIRALMEPVGASVAKLSEDAEPPHFALAWLGMGGDGHIASLFVGRSWDGDRVIHVPDSPKPPPERMSLTHALLSTASTHVLYAVGESKRDAIARVLREDSELPASTLSGVTLVTTPGWDQP